MKKLGQLFETAAAMNICALIAAFTGVLSGILFHFVDEAANVQHLLYILQGMIAFFLLIAYDKHDKNVMKGLLGAMLTTLVINELCYFYGTFQTMLSSARERGVAFGLIMLFVEVLIVIAMAVIFVTHFIINSDHHSSPSLIRTNQIMLIEIICLILVQKLYTVCLLGTTSERCIAELIWIALEVCSFGTVVCIESKLDAYRKIREKKAG